MMLTQEHKDALIREFTAMLDDPTCEATIRVGTHGTPNYRTGFYEFAPTKGRTITVTIHGGATDTREPAGYVRADGTVELP